MEKLCHGCQHTLPVSEFGVDSKNKSGLRSRCRACVRDDDRARRTTGQKSKTPEVPPPGSPAVGRGWPCHSPLDSADSFPGRGSVDAEACAVRGERQHTPPSDTRPTCIAILADTHHPEHEPAMWSATLRLLADVRPDEVVIAGDFGEFAAGSRHIPAAFQPAWEGEREEIRRALRQLRAACPTARITYCQGNHETMLERSIMEHMPSLASSFSLPDELQFSTLGIEWVPETRQPIKRGTLQVLHGHQLGKFLPKHHAAKVADLYGAEGTTTVIGHSHRAGVFTRPLAKGIARGVALGAGRLMDPAWLRGNPAGWSQEVGIAYLRADGKATVYPVPWEGSFVWAGTEYR